VSADVHSLAGAYALDALDDVDRAQFTRHLASCAPCRAEVEDYLATTERLGAAAAETPPPALRARVLAEVDVTRQLAPRPAPTAQGVPTGWRRALAPVAAAAAAVVLTLVAVGLTRGPDPDRDLAAAAAAVLAAPDARAVPLETDGGFTATVVAAPSTGRAVLAASGLDEQEGPDVYVVWTYRDGAPVREEPMAAEGDDDTALVVLDDVEEVAQVAVTVEPPGDDPEPAGPVVAQVALR
jgi:anti-sigma-K factor RskA